jgi:hypothetical protein
MAGGYCLAAGQLQSYPVDKALFSTIKFYDCANFTYFSLGTAIADCACETGLQETENFANPTFREDDLS